MVIIKILNNNKNKNLIKTLNNKTMGSGGLRIKIKLERDWWRLLKILINITNTLWTSDINLI